MKQIILILIIAAIGCAPKKYKPEVITRLECNMEDQKAKHALVAYATRAGSTAEVAQAIGKELCAKGLQVNVTPVVEVKDISNYDLVVLGTPVRMGRVMPESKKFLKKFKNELENKKTAYFIVCITMKEDTPQNREIAGKYADQLSKIKKPQIIGLFGGLSDPSRLTGIWKLAFRNAKKEDARNWDYIRSWAQGLYP